MLLSLGVNKRDLSSQSFAVCTEAMGDPRCVCVGNSPTTLRALTHTHTHNLVSWSIQCVCVCVCMLVCKSICMWLSWCVCPLRRTGVSMERGACWWACLGQRPSFDTGAEGNLCSPRNVENQDFFVTVELWTAAASFSVWKCKVVQTTKKRNVSFH